MSLVSPKQKIKKSASGRLTITWGRCGEEVRLPAGDWLTDVRERERKKVPHDPHPVAPQLRRAGRH